MICIHVFICKLGRLNSCHVSCFIEQPVLPNCAVCLLCDLDVRVKAEGGEEMMTTTLMECGICWEILHPACLTSKSPDITNEGVISEDLPNSWECPKCCDDGKKGMIKVQCKCDGKCDGKSSCFKASTK